MGQIIADHFSAIFQTSIPIDLHRVIDLIPEMLSEQDVSVLDKPFTQEEVYAALKEMDSTKAPGPDGFIPAFFQRFWTKIGHDICSLILRFLNDGINLSLSLNFTNIVLIPKVDNPDVIGDFRPISLCNVLYRIITKTITNRLKNFMDKIISQQQSALIPGRLITYNVMIS